MNVIMGSPYVKYECNDGQSRNLLIKKMNESLVSSVCLKFMNINDSCKHLAELKYFSMRPLIKVFFFLFCFALTGKDHEAHNLENEL